MLNIYEYSGIILRLTMIFLEVRPFLYGREFGSEPSFCSSFDMIQIIWFIEPSKYTEYIWTIALLRVAAATSYEGHTSLGLNIIIFIFYQAL